MPLHKNGENTSEPQISDRGATTRGVKQDAAEPTVDSLNANALNWHPPGRRICTPITDSKKGNYGKRERMAISNSSPVTAGADEGKPLNYSSPGKKYIYKYVRPTNYELNLMVAAEDEKMEKKEKMERAQREPPVPLKPHPSSYLVEGYPSQKPVKPGRIIQYNKLQSFISEKIKRMKERGDSIKNLINGKPDEEPTQSIPDDLPIPPQRVELGNATIAFSGDTEALTTAQSILKGSRLSHTNTNTNTNTLRGARNGSSVGRSQGLVALQSEKVVGVVGSSGLQHEGHRMNWKPNIPPTLGYLPRLRGQLHKHSHSHSTSHHRIYQKYNIHPEGSTGTTGTTGNTGTTQQVNSIQGKKEGGGDGETNTSYRNGSHRIPLFKRYQDNCHPISQRKRKELMDLKDKQTQSLLLNSSTREYIRQIIADGATTATENKSNKTNKSNQSNYTTERKNLLENITEGPIKNEGEGGNTNINNTTNTKNRRNVIIGKILEIESRNEGKNIERRTRTLTGIPEEAKPPKLPHLKLTKRKGKSCTHSQINLHGEISNNEGGINTHNNNMNMNMNIPMNSNKSIRRYKHLEMKECYKGVDLHKYSLEDLFQNKKINLLRRLQKEKNCKSMGIQGDLLPFHSNLDTINLQAILEGGHSNINNKNFLKDLFNQTNVGNLPHSYFTLNSNLNPTEGNNTQNIGSYLTNHEKIINQEPGVLNPLKRPIVKPDTSRMQVYPKPNVLNINVHITSRQINIDENKSK